MYMCLSRSTCIVESTLRDYKVVGQSLGELKRLQLLHEDRKPEWLMYGLKDAPDHKEKLQQIKVKNFVALYVLILNSLLPFLVDYQS